MRKYLILCLLALSACSLATAQNNVADEVIWVVGEEAILKSDVENTRIDAQTLGQHIDGDPYCVIPEQLAIQKLFLHQAAIDSVEATDSEVLQRVEMRISYYIQQMGSKEKMEEYFDKPTVQIREQLFENIKNELLIQKVREKLVEGVKVTPAQVRQYFKGLPEDSIPFIPTKYEVQILTRYPIISQEEIDRVKNELREFTESVNNGEKKFSTLAVMYSEDLESAKQGGQLGFLTRGQLVPTFASAAFNLTDPNTVSKIVETEYGFHIIQLIEKRGDRVNVRHILRKPRVSDDELAAAVQQVDTILNDINDGKYTFDECVAHYSQDKDTYNNFGLMMLKDDDGMVVSSRLELSDMPSSVARTVSRMNTGEISKPFVMIDKNGKEAVAIVKVKLKIEGHKATMRDDYQELQDVLRAKLCEDKVNAWIREMQQKTYVRINEDWRNCEFQYPGWIKE